MRFIKTPVGVGVEQLMATANDIRGGTTLAV